MDSIENCPRDIHDYLNGVAEGRLCDVIRMADAMRIAMQDVELFDLSDRRIHEAEKMSDYLERTEFKCTGQWKSFNESTRERLMPELVERIGVVSNVRAWDTLAQSSGKLSLEGLIGFLGIALMSELRLCGEESYSDYLRGHLAKLRLGKRDFGIYLAGLLLDCCHPAKRTMVLLKGPVDDVGSASITMEKTLARVVKILSAMPVTPYEKVDRRIQAASALPGKPTRGNFAYSMERTAARAHAK